MLNLLPKYLENRFIQVEQILGTITAGQEVELTVPANKIWIVLSFYSLFSSDATVSNRQVRIIPERAGNRLAMSRFPFSIPAGINVSLGATLTASEVTVNVGGLSCSLPLVQLKEGDKFKTQTLNLQPGDQYTTVSVVYLEADITQP